MRASGPTWKLAAVGTAAGVFSGLLGVGGGAVIVPLLVLWLGYDERVGTGTSLAAILLIAALALTVPAFYGNLGPGGAAPAGLPAVAGVVGGWGAGPGPAPSTLS